MSFKISFMHYRNNIMWARLKSPLAFEEFDMICIFCLLFSFHYHCQFVKGQLKQKSTGAAAVSKGLG